MSCLSHACRVAQASLKYILRMCADSVRDACVCHFVLNSPSTLRNFCVLCAHCHVSSYIKLILATSVVYASCHLCVLQPQFSLHQILVVLCLPHSSLCCSSSLDSLLY